MSGGLLNAPFDDFSDADTGDGLIEYLDAATRVSAEQKRATFAAQKLGPGMRVLDVGCGTGDDVRAIAGIVGPNGRAAGVDRSRTMIEEARARGVPANAEFALAEAGALPFEEASFDAARAERVFQHLAQPEPAARELYRVLKPGGTALLLDQDWESLIVAGESARSPGTSCEPLSTISPTAGPDAKRAACCGAPASPASAACRSCRLRSFRSRSKPCCSPR